MNCICFNINGKPYTVNAADCPADTSLNTFIRNHAHLSGTKIMCNEGGCGVCIVTVKRVHPLTKKLETIAVNSCLMAVYACHNVDVVTIEGIGNAKDGYCPEQTRLLQKNGTQCGYCSPGMIMNMHSLLESDEGMLTMEKVENSFGGNICRCTGYRPILDAFKSFAVDADNALLCHDIEDLPKVYNGSNCGKICHKIFKEAPYLKFKDGSEWYKVYTVTEILKILVQISPNTPYMLLAGNTAHGVYPSPYDVKLFIDINDVPDLRSHSITNNELIIGANKNLTETIRLFDSVSRTPGFEYCLTLAQHIDQIANVPVRNIGTIAGNLSIKHQENAFPSDIIVILEAVGAKMTIVDAVDSNKITVNMAEYLTLDMTKKVILNVKLPVLAKTFFKFKTYKITIRAQNSHAYVNAAFLFKFNSNVVESARICYGGINSEFIHARDTEAFLRGKKLHTNETLRTGINVLENELTPDSVLPDASPEYRRLLAVSLFYKFFLSTCNESLIRKEYRSGAFILKRPLSSGTQSYDTQKDKYPLTEPIVKYEGLAQISGAAIYANDVPHLHNELWAVFVSATKVHSKIGKIDATEALAIPGVRYFFSALDIPGKNNFTPSSAFLYGLVEDEEIFVGHKSEVLFFGQPVGIVLADTYALASFAATKVKILYLENDSYFEMARTLLNPWLGGKQILTIEDVFNSKGIQFSETTESKIKGAAKKIKGRFALPSQYHMHMEPQTTVCIPTDDGILVHTSTQWPDLTHIAISECLKIPENSIYMEVKGVGGGFGAKVTRSAQIACACALGCHLTGQPVRFVMSLKSNMNVIGKRNAMIGEYTADVDNNGKIIKLSNKSAFDMGCSLNDSPTALAKTALANCYDASSWDVKIEDIKTDAPSMTWFRGPGTLEAIVMAEIVMEHISKVVDKDPVTIRISNMSSDSKMKKMMLDFVKDVELDDRKKKIDDFNKKNRWNKKGIAIAPMRFPMEYSDTYNVYVCVYHNDGTVVVGHGGVEIGQGINTKITQVAAHILGINHSFIKIRPTDNVIGANSGMTGTSISSEMVCFGVAKACEEIMNRVKPIRDANKYTQWVDITKAAYKEQISLSVAYTARAKDLSPYDVLGLSCSEIEIDLLTGNILIHRVDILEDVGQSTNPLVDIGQIEGAFVMGIGYWLTEALIYDRRTGELTTNRTWNYKPPTAKDIPVDFRIKLLPNSSGSPLILDRRVVILKQIILEKSTIIIVVLAVGEPAIILAISVHFALRNALEAARWDAGIKDDPWFRLTAPSTPEVISLTAGHATGSLKL